MKDRIIVAGKDFGLEELVHFLVSAKRACYAGDGKEEVLPDGSKKLTFQRGKFHYTDDYAGYFQVQGTEVVRWGREDGQRIWQMSYSGGMFPGFLDDELAHQTFLFLKKALRMVSREMPFRGPEHQSHEPSFYDGQFSYSTKTNGTVKNFSGKEEISHKFHGAIFKQNYIGGLVIPK